MSPSLATLAYSLGIAGLFLLNRDKSVCTSKALWIPVIWSWILGSRAVSQWLGMTPPGSSAETMMDGSPFDALIFQLLIAGGVVVLLFRAQRCRTLLMANQPIFWYFAYCLLSVLWSDYPEVSAKRWIKAIGDLVMALVVATDPQPVAAMRRLFSRVGFVLVPASTLVMKYYPWLGRTYDDWTGQLLYTGVTTEKNILGVTTYIYTIGAFWQVLRIWRKRGLRNRLRQFVAQGTLVGFGLWNLFSANSATAESCLVLAASLMLLTGLRRIGNRPSAVHALVATAVVLGALLKITGADEAVFHALGRNSDLTGRASQIWPLVFPMCPNVLLGAGFESFWLGPRLQEVWKVWSYVHISEAHNGYLEMYLNLGAIGVCLVIAILIHGYRRSVNAFRIDPESGGLALAFVLASALYSYTEAGFRTNDPPWGFLLLAIIYASAISRTYRSGVKLNGSPVESTNWSTGSTPTPAALVRR
jgi:exopolysaccharide production protein ExoQ